MTNFKNAKGLRSISSIGVFSAVSSAQESPLSPKEKLGDLLAACSDLLAKHKEKIMADDSKEERDLVTLQADLTKAALAITFFPANISNLRRGILKLDDLPEKIRPAFALCTQNNVIGMLTRTQVFLLKAGIEHDEGLFDEAQGIALDELPPEEHAAEEASDFNELLKKARARGLTI